MVSSRGKSPIVSRSQWGAKPWRRKRPTVPLSARRFFVLHYHGGPVSQQYGVAVPRNVERIHLDNGWSGVGYNFVVDQAGVIYEGHGWHLQGAHSPPHNRDGIGVYIAVGGNQVPSEAAKRSARWLYEEQRRLTGRTPQIWWHGRDFATACPGPHLIAWAKAGMPITTFTPGAAAPSGETTMSDAQIQRNAGIGVHNQRLGRSGPAIGTAIQSMYARLTAPKIASAVWSATVRRNGEQVNALQELADCKTEIQETRRDLAALRELIEKGSL